MSGILSTLNNLIASSLGNTPPLPQKIADIQGRLAELLALELEPTGSGIESWLAKLRAIANDEEMHDTLVVRVLQMKFPRIAEALTMLGAIEFHRAQPGGPPTHFRLRKDLIQQWTTSPSDQALTLLLGKINGTDDIKALQALILLLISAPDDLLAREYNHLGFTALPRDAFPEVNLTDLTDLVNSPLGVDLPFDEPLADFPLRAHGPPFAGSYVALDGPGFPIPNQLDGLLLDIFLGQGYALKPVDLDANWQLTFRGNTDAGRHYGLRFEGGRALRPLVAPPVGDLEMLLTRSASDGGNALLIGEVNGSHFAIGKAHFGLRLRAPAAAGDPLFTFVMRLEKISFVLKPDFLKFMSFGLNLPALLTFETDVETSYVQGKGLTGQGGASLPALGVQFTAPVNLKIGGSGANLRLDHVVTRLEATYSGRLLFRLSMRYGANAEFGPLQATLTGAGVWLGRWTDGVGGLEPPTGIGLTLDAGPVKGGGFLGKVGEEEFGGALQLKVMGIGAFAYGLFKTMPNGSPSFVALIGIRLPLPGVQIGFGFAISGFGGLVGINRRADTDKLRARLQDGSAGNVLFNDNPARDAMRLLSDMAQFFPDQPGSFLIGPTLQLNWLFVLWLDLGVFIEIPAGTVILAGSARLVIGSESLPLVYLRLDFMGVIDPSRSLISFDAALVNSHILGIFRVTGGVALRINYGPNGYFLFTVGGFHPEFRPGAMDAPRVARVGTGVSLGIVWFKQEMYLAITSNTFQLGMRVEAGLELGPISAHGWFGFDALVQFRPFHFIATVDAGFSVEVFNVSFCSVRITGQLSGPGPLVLSARASVKVLFVRVSESITVTINDNPAEVLERIENLGVHLAAELGKPDNLRFEGEDRGVRYLPPVDRVTDANARLQVPPATTLVWEQKRAPLNLKLEKFGGIDLVGDHQLTLIVVGAAATRPETDWFGMGAFIKVNDAEALNNNAFMQQDAGLRIAGVFKSGVESKANLTLDLIKLPQPTFARMVLEFAGAQYVHAGLSAMLSERDGRATLDPGKPAVSVKQEVWGAFDAQGKSVTGAIERNAAQAFMDARVIGGVARAAADKPLVLAGVL